MDKLEAIKLLFENHIGKGNEISAQVIEDMYGNPTDKTHKTARDLIDACIKKYKLPIAANNNGYFRIANQAEYEEYMRNLDSRIAGIEDKKKVITEFFKEKQL